MSPAQAHIHTAPVDPALGTWSVENEAQFLLLGAYSQGPGMAEQLEEYLGMGRVRQIVQKSSPSLCRSSLSSLPCQSDCANVVLASQDRVTGIRGFSDVSVSIQTRITSLKSAVCLLEVSFTQGGSGSRDATKGNKVQKPEPRSSLRFSPGLHSLWCFCI